MGFWCQTNCSNFLKSTIANYQLTGLKIKLCLYKINLCWTCFLLQRRKIWHFFFVLATLFAVNNAVGCTFADIDDDIPIFRKRPDLAESSGWCGELSGILVVDFVAYSKLCKPKTNGNGWVFHYYQLSHLLNHVEENMHAHSKFQSKIILILLQSACYKPGTSVSTSNSFSSRRFLFIWFIVSKKLLSSLYWFRFYVALFARYSAI